jgi:hypothetical protein
VGTELVFYRYQFVREHHLYPAEIWQNNCSQQNLTGCLIVQSCIFIHGLLATICKGETHLS